MQSELYRSNSTPVHPVAEGEASGIVACHSLSPDAGVSWIRLSVVLFWSEYSQRLTSSPQGCPAWSGGTAAEFALRGLSPPITSEPVEHRFTSARLLAVTLTASSVTTADARRVSASIACLSPIVLILIGGG